MIQLQDLVCIYHGVMEMFMLIMHRFSGGRLEKSFIGRDSQILNKPVLWSYVRDGNTAKLYLNNGLEQMYTSLTSAFQQGDVGRFTIGNGNNATNYADMKFYCLIVFKRAMNDLEINQMSKYLMHKFKI